MKKKIIFSLVALAVICLGLVYYSKIVSRDDGELRIGVILPLSGEYAAAGENVKKGIELAKDQFESKNPGKKVVLSIEDDGFNAQKGLAAYKKLTTIDDIQGLVNISTPVIEALYGDINRDGIPTAQLGLQETGVTDDYVFQMSPDDVMMIEKYARYLSRNEAFKKLVIVHENTSFHNRWIEPFKNNYSPGVAGVFTLNSKDSIRQTLLQAMAVKPDAMVIFMNSEIGALFTKELVNVYKERPTLVYDAQLQSGWEDYKRILGDRNVMNGSLAIWLKGGDAAPFVSAFKEKFGSEPGFWADIGYDAFLALANAYDPNAAVWEQNLQKTRMPGASGYVSFDPRGVRLQPIVINEVKNGELVLRYSEPD